MIRSITVTLQVTISGMILSLATATTAPAEEMPGRAFGGPTTFAEAKSLKASSAEAVRDRAFQWLEGRKVDRATLESARELWQADDLAEAGEAPVLTTLVSTLALGDSRIAELAAFTARPPEEVLLPDFGWLSADDGLDPWVARNLRVHVGRWLAREQYYDEALAMIGELEPEQVVDPATLLFYQAVTHMRLLNKEPGLTAVSRLIDDVAQPPSRYYAIAALMQYDLEQLDEKSLDHLARRMKDVEIRLTKGRAGKTVQVKQDDIVASLDQMIEQLEQQQQQQQGGGGASGPAGGIQSNAPAQESSAAGGQGEGEVDRQDHGPRSNWGELDPKDRERALQDVTKTYPSYYREIVQEYFRKRAAEESTTP